MSLANKSLRNAIMTGVYHNIAGKFMEVLGHFSVKFPLEATVGVEPTYNSFAGCTITVLAYRLVTRLLTTAPAFLMIGERGL